MAAIKRSAPKLVKAYSCPNCGRVFRHDAHGKAAASMCCTCPECKGPCDRYMGVNDKLCSACKKEAVWSHVTRNLREMLGAYERAAHEQNRRDHALEQLLSDYVLRTVAKHSSEKGKRNG